MAAYMTISYHDDTHEEIEFNEENGLYWKIIPQGLMIKTQGVRGSRTVYPWAAIRKYHIETEVGLRDREEAARNRLAEAYGRRGRPVGRRRDVQLGADQSSRGSQGRAAERSE